MLPSELLKFLHDKVSKKHILIFLTAFFSGLFIHLFRLTNTLLIWDSVFNFHDSQNTIHLGRWFLTIACGISSYYDLQWLNGFLCLIYLSIVSVLLVKIFDIHSTLIGMLVALLTVSFPTVASTFAYMYTADGYLFGLVLMLVGLYLTLKYKRGFVPGFILLAFGLGCYQAYLGFVITLILLLFIKLLLFDLDALKRITSLIPRFALFGILGLLTYGIINKVLLYIERIELSEYNGISDMGFSLSNIPTAITNCIIDFIYFFFGPLSKFSLYQALNYIFWLVVIYMLIISLKHLYSDIIGGISVVRTIGLLICLLLMPVGCGVIYFISPSVRYYMMMHESYLSIYLIPLVLCDKLVVSIDKSDFYSSRVDSRLISCWAVFVLNVFLIANFSIISNIAYNQLEASNQSTFALVNRMVDRIEMLPQYDQIDSICIVGHMDNYDVIEKSIPPAMSGLRDGYFIDNEKHFAAIMSDRFGLSLTTCNPAEHEAYSEDSQILSSPVWPDVNSVSVRNSTVIFHF